MDRLLLKENAGPRANSKKPDAPKEEFQNYLYSPSDEQIALDANP